MSIGSNDMTQLTLGLDRDSGVIAKLFDERDDAVKALMAMAIKACKSQGKYVGICGQGPSDHPELARWLVEQGIDSLSLNPDTVVETWMFLAQSRRPRRRLRSGRSRRPAHREAAAGARGSTRSSRIDSRTSSCARWVAFLWNAVLMCGAQRCASSLSVLTSRLR